MSWTAECQRQKQSAEAMSGGTEMKSATVTPMVKTFQL
jgi:hypothetical protein